MELTVTLLHDQICILAYITLLVMVRVTLMAMTLMMMHARTSQEVIYMARPVHGDMGLFTLTGCENPRTNYSLL